MKLKSSALVIAMTAMISMPAMASFGGEAKNSIQLAEGISSTQILSGGHPISYELNVERDSLLSISSGQRPGASSAGVRIQGKLVNQSGEVVARSNGYNGRFSLTERVSPGSYTLIVSGNAPAGGEPDRSRYNLHVKYD
ncbi:hypothetical protein [Halomonas faecis]|uniref:hypothetical protein n=1 Tax=Halomonas faecis TaxID=1562110 RepID=UPI0013D857E7|nr:hypothetical protein [Halomonas faecis]